MSNIAEHIVKFYESKPQLSRPHLGGSAIGKKCSRALWYSFRWVKSPSFDGRMLRLFSTGQLAEARFVKELRDIGGNVMEFDDRGRQFGFSDFGGHFSGSCDAVAENLPGVDGWALVEMKTHSEKSFEWLKKNGVKVAKPEHWAQMMVYMGYMDLQKAIYLANNKNNDELYTEEIEFDKTAFESFRNKAISIIKSESPPVRISDAIDNFECQYCDYQNICHHDEVSEVNCRTCAHSTPDVDDGGWVCGAKQAKPETELQRVGCQEHLFIPSLLNFATAYHGSNDFVAYETKDGRKFANAVKHAENEYGTAYTSAEIKALGSSLGNARIEEIKEVFPGTKVVSILDLESDDLDKANVKADSPSEKAKKESIKKSVAAIPRSSGWSDKPIKYK